mgnify:CR=1 FL=1
MFSCRRLASRLFDWEGKDMRAQIQVDKIGINGSCDQN